jgi:hypothetical protein
VSAPTDPQAAPACARCPEPPEPGGRYCAPHRQEHGAKLAAQLQGIIADHQDRVEAARNASTDKMARTCGHPPAALRVIDGKHYCGACISEDPDD